MHGSVAVTELD